MGLFDRLIKAIRMDDEDEEEDYLDEDDDFDDLDDDFTDSPKAKKRFFSRFRSNEADDEDLDADPDSEFEESEEPVRRRRPAPVRSRETKKTENERFSDPSEAKSGFAVSSDDSHARTYGSSRSAYRRGQRFSDYSPSETAFPAKGTASGSQTYSKKKSRPVTEGTSRKSDQSSTIAGMEVNVMRPSSMNDTREIADTLMNHCTVVLNLEGLDVDIAQRILDFTCGVCYSRHGKLQKVSSYIFIVTPEDVDISGDFQSILSGAFNIPSMHMGY